MKTRSAILVFLAVCAAVVVIFGLFRFFIQVSRIEPSLTAHLSLHELITPGNSNLSPETLKVKLSEDALWTWIEADNGKQNDADSVLSEILRYLTVSIMADLPEDPLVQYKHYYHLEIENDSNTLFKDVNVRFPAIEAVEVRRRNSEPTLLNEQDGRYYVGAVGPYESVDVYAWSIRPFYAEEKYSIVLRHGKEPVEIYEIKMIETERSWIKDNLLLVFIFGGLALFLTQKMIVIVRLYSKNVNPEIEKKIELG